MVFPVSHFMITCAEICVSHLPVLFACVVLHGTVDIKMILFILIYCCLIKLVCCKDVVNVVSSNWLKKNSKICSVFKVNRKFVFPSRF